MKRLPRRALLALTLWTALLAAAPGRAAEEEATAPCDVPADLLQANLSLPNTAAALAGGELRIAIWRTQPALTTSDGSSPRDYPEQLQDDLARQFPDTRVRVQVIEQPGRTAREMLRAIAALDASAPQLVIWQTGSVDALRNVSLQEFAHALSAGIGRLRAAGRDVMLMDLQYGPHSRLLTAADTYHRHLWWMARREDVPLIPRYDIMEDWEEDERFDLSAPDRSEQRRNARAIQRCMGDIIGWMIVNATRAPASVPDTTSASRN